MWKTSPPRPSETPDPGFRKGGTHPSGLKYNGDVLSDHISALNWNVIQEYTLTFCKRTPQDTRRLQVWTLHVACKSVHFDRGGVFLSTGEKQVVKTLKRLKVF